MSDLTQHKDYFKQDMVKVGYSASRLSIYEYIFLTDALSTMNSEENKE